MLCWATFPAMRAAGSLWAAGWTPLQEILAHRALHTKVLQTRKSRYQTNLPFYFLTVFLFGSLGLCNIILFNEQYISLDEKIHLDHLKQYRVPILCSKIN